METSYEYQRPIENEDLVHKIALTIEGKKIGEASLEYRNNPFPFYYLDFIYIDKAYTGQGLGRQLFEQVNKFLEDHGRPGILMNVIHPEDPAHGLCERHGWKPIENQEKWMGYKIDQIEQGRLDKAINAIAMREVREDIQKPMAA